MAGLGFQGLYLQTLTEIQTGALSASVIFDNEILEGTFPRQHTLSLKKSNTLWRRIWLGEQTLANGVAVARSS